MERFSCLIACSGQPDGLRFLQSVLNNISNVVRLQQPDGAFHSEWEVYAPLNKNVFRRCLNVVVDEHIVCFTSFSSRLHAHAVHCARDAAIENARSPNRCYVRGRKRLLLLQLSTQRRAWWHQGCFNKLWKNLGSLVSFTKNLTSSSAIAERPCCRVG